MAWLNQLEEPPNCLEFTFNGKVRLFSRKCSKGRDKGSKDKNSDNTRAPGALGWGGTSHSNLISQGAWLELTR